MLQLFSDSVVTLIFSSGTKATRKAHPVLLFLSHLYHRCNKHLLGLGQEVKASLTEAGLIGYQFGTVGVSDGISMGTGGMRYSLQSRDLIADQVETAAGGHHLDGLVTIPGCDKNMPGVLMARKPLLLIGLSTRSINTELCLQSADSTDPV